jgi:hypothetical protein
MTVIELDRRDRTTLRVWKIANVVGWGSIASLSYNVIVTTLFRTFVQKLANSRIDDVVVAGVFGLLLYAGATAGWIVGGRVYRNPLVVTAAVIIFPWSLVLFVFPMLTYSVVPFAPSAGVLVWMFTRSPLEAVQHWAFIVVPMVTAPATASLVWRRRPAALRRTLPRPRR